MHPLCRVGFFLCLASCIGEQKDKTEPFDVEEVVQEMAREQRQSLWERLASLLQDVLQELPPEHWDEGMEVESPVDPVSFTVCAICTVVINIFMESYIFI